MQYSESRFRVPEPDPGDEFYHTRSEQMEKPLLMTHPDVPCTVVGEGIDDSVRYGCYGNKPVGLEKGNPALRPDPQLPASVLKEGMRLVRQPTVFAIHLDLAVHPSIQPIRCADPKTAIPRDHNGSCLLYT